MSKLSLISAVICDEVRREASGEAIIIGAKQVGPAILVGEEGSTQEPIAFYIELESDYPPPASITIRLRKMFDEEVVFEHAFEGGADVPTEIPEGAEPTGVLLMVINQKSSPVSEPGPYVLECRSDDDEWIKLRDMVFPAVERPRDEPN